MYLLTIAGEFTLDTLIALISCIAGIIALFLGGKAYNSCRKYTTNFKEKKVFKHGGTDNSQQAKVINNYNGLDAASSTALIEFTRETFKDCMNLAYERFEQQTNENMKNIIAQTCRIVEEKKLELGSYTKIDWINVYFESAKNSSDEFMQKIWAKVLAKELSCPNSFSYKTLDILKNMSSEDFKLFQKLCSLQVEGYILNGDLTTQYGLSWADQLKLKDFSLLNLELSTKSYTISKNKGWICRYQDKYVLVAYTNSKSKNTIKLPVHTLSTFALELINVAELTLNMEYIIAFTRYIKSQMEENDDVKLHKMNHIVDKTVDFDVKDLASEKSE